jgi:hypothetical protein
MQFFQLQTILLNYITNNFLAPRLYSVRSATAVSLSNHTGQSIDPTRREFIGELVFFIEVKILIIKHDSIFVVLQGSQSSQAPSMS